MEESNYLQKVLRGRLQQHFYIYNRHRFQDSHCGDWWEGGTNNLEMATNVALRQQR